MFGRKKKKDAKQQETAAVEPAVNHDELVSQAEQLSAKLEGTSGADRSDLLDEQGSLYMKAGEDDLAIEAFEASVKEIARMGTAYKSLTTLYNRKRAAAAAAGDDEALKLWLDKLQALMQSSKDMLRGK
jgi:tetratricopeptide (TPR) repeat protein